MKKYKGFTLIEVLLVVALIIFLFAIVIIAINPAKQLRDARNAQRSSDVNQILNAVTQYTSEQEGGVTKTPVDLGIPECGGVVEDADAIGLEDELVAEYIVAIPTDPHASVGESGYTTCYTALDFGDDVGRITIKAPLAEQTTITVSR